jgi:basic membrane lipoprotein Med (substrate-binding protein (PBP1-ABC) superfamily)
MSKKLYILLTVVVVAAMLLSSCSVLGGGKQLTKNCTPDKINAMIVKNKVLAAIADSPVAQKDLKVGLVTDVGKVNDGTFNQLAYEGAKRAADEVGFTFNYIETTSSDDYAKNIETFANEGYNHIIGVGYMIQDTVKAEAAKFPKINFTMIDGSADPVIPNVHGVIFREDQSGMVAGVVAGCMTKSGTVGIVGGMEIPAVKKFRNGYEAGVKLVCPDCKVVGVYIDSFTDPARGKAAAESQIAEGADVIFGAGGPTGSGGILGAAQQGVWVIGVDQDEYLTTFKGGTEKGADKLLTSAMKKVDVGVYTSIMETVKGTFKGGTLTFEAANNGVSAAPYHDADKSVSQDIKDTVKKVLDLLASGKLQTGVDPLTGDKK